MNLPRWTLVLSLFLTVKANYIDFVVDYVKANDIKLLYSLTCWSISEKVEVTKRLHKENVRTAFLTSDGAPAPGFVVVDLSCAGMVEFKTPSSILLLDYDAGPTANGTAGLFPEGSRVDAAFLKQDNQTESFEILRLSADGSAEIGSWNANGLNLSKRFNTWRKDMRSVVLRKEGIKRRKGRESHEKWVVDRQPTIQLKNSENGVATSKKTGNWAMFECENGKVNATSEGDFEDYMMDTRNSGHDSTMKFFYAVFKLLQDIHGFSYNVALVAPNTQIPKLLQDERIEIVISGELMSTAKISTIDYVVPSSFYIKTCFLYENPREYPELSMGFLKLFANSTWIVLALVSLAIAVCMKITYSVYVKFLGDPGEETSWSAAFLAVLCAICQESVPTCLSSTSCRLVIVSLLILSVLLYDYFTAIAVSYLMNSQPPSYKSLGELAESDLEIAFDNQTVEWLKSTRLPEVRKLFRKAGGGNKAKIYSAKYGMEMVMSQKMAYHVDATVGYELVSQMFTQGPICDLVEVPMIPSGTAGFALRKYSPYRDLFQASLRHMAETGITHRLKRIWQKDKPECYLDSRVFPIGMDRAFGTLLFLIVGSVLTFPVLAFEILWKKFDHLGSGHTYAPLTPHSHHAHAPLQIQKCYFT